MPIIFMCIFMGAAVAWGDIVDDGLPDTTAEPIKASTRQMVNLGLKSDIVVEMTRLMLENKYSHKQILKAHTVLINAHKQGLPTAPMINKAHEGMAKHVDPSGVVQAMERVQARYAFAAKQAKSITHDEANMARLRKIIAESLAAGMHHDDAARIMQTLQLRARQMTKNQAADLAEESFLTARTMARRSIHSRSVADSICEALQKGFSAKEMHEMRNSIMASSRHSMTKSPGMNDSQPGGHSDRSGTGHGTGGHGGGMDGHGGDPGGDMGGGHSF